MNSLCNNLPSSLSAWLDRLETLHPDKIDLGLERCACVYQRMTARYKKTQDAILPRLAQKVIVVGGTNGKGSTIAAIESMLLSKHYSVGAYTSPHIHVYNERVRINGADVSDADLLKSFDAVESFRGETRLTYFEFGTLSALELFHRADLDVVLLEVGLGGRLDAVNIIDADLSVITSIDFDHVDWLGCTLEEIGFEKSGIFRMGKPAILGQRNLPDSVLNQAKKNNVPIYVFDKDFGVTNCCERVFSLPYTNIPESNLCCALEVLHHMGVFLTQDEINTLVSHIQVLGRLEKLTFLTDLWVDVAHNPHAARFLASKLAMLSQGRPIYAIYSALVDKDAKAVIKAMDSVVNYWVLAPLHGSRAMSGSELYRCAKENAISFILLKSIEEALDFVTENAVKEDAIVIAFGSFLTVEIIRSLTQKRVIT